jgi:hypothetical protein
MLRGDAYARVADLEAGSALVHPPANVDAPVGGCVLVALSRLGRWWLGFRSEEHCIAVERQNTGAGAGRP